MNLLFFLLVVAVAVLGQSPCSMPNQFTTGVTQVVVENTWFTSNIQTLYFDYPNQQMRVDQTATVGGSSYAFTSWFDYNKGILYFYNRDSEECTSSPLSGGLSDMQIPANSEYLGTTLIGTQAVDNWLSPDNNGRGMYSYVGLTNPTCWPVNQIALNDSTNQPLYTFNMWNFVPQLPPFYFDIPSGCMNARVAASTDVATKLRPKFPFLF